MYTAYEQSMDSREERDFYIKKWGCSSEICQIPYILLESCYRGVAQMDFYPEEVRSNSKTTDEMTLPIFNNDRDNSFEDPILLNVFD